MSNEKYYVPHGTYWPIIGSIGISTLFIGFANQMHDVSWGWPVMVLGLCNYCIYDVWVAWNSCS